MTSRPFCLATGENSPIRPNGSHDLDCSLGEAEIRPADQRLRGCGPVTARPANVGGIPLSPSDHSTNSPARVSILAGSFSDFQLSVSKVWTHSRTE
jgi:hypothetical protein